jgi:NAD(P)-dependent dehydrogenase (short-subunit alcohol dehydrogenase family)
MQIKQRTALVTGGGSGIGQAAALALKNKGFRLAIAGRRKEALKATADLLGSDTLICPADLQKEHEVAHLFDLISREFGRLDLLFNNAGVNTPPTAFEDLSLADWNHVIGVNLTSAFLCAQAAFRLMKEQRPAGGRIINNGSISSTSPRPHAAAYTASKHGILGLTRTISLEGRRYGIACGQIDIGNTATPLADGMSRGMLQADLSIRPEPTFDVRHVADAVAYMADLPLDVNVQSLTVLATSMPYVGRG